MTSLHGRCNARSVHEHCEREHGEPDADTAGSVPLGQPSCTAGLLRLKERQKAEIALPRVPDAHGRVTISKGP